MPMSSIGSALSFRPCLRFALLLAAAMPVSAQTPPVPDDRQILWQRSLEDALAIAQAEHRPILVAVNMDGESASERIVKENYRDPKFVAMTRRFVCVVASAFRHAPRDHDERGRRIPCPRLGEITCGEHIALEPILFDEYLGGERIAPRHALILPDGTKSFDLFLLFDLGELDRKIADSQELAPPPQAAAVSPVESRSLADLAGARDHRSRLEFETRLLLGNRGLETSRIELTEQDREAAWSAIEESGDAGSVEALRILLATRPSPAGEFLPRLADAAKSLKIESAVAGMVRERLSSLGRWPGAPGLGEDEELLSLLGSLDAGSASSRSLLLAYATLGTDSEAALASAALREGNTVLEDPTDRSSIASWLATLDSTPVPSAATAERPDDLREAAALETELARLDEGLSGKPGDPDLLAEYGKATLALARRRMESGGSGAQLLLQDADHFLEQAARARPQDASILLARARTNYLLGRFEEQERIAEEAVAVARGDDRTEALRWLGDASARLLASRSGGDPAVEARGVGRGAKAFLLILASPEAGETDWVSLGSFLGALGLRREELAVCQAGAERLPSSAALRSAMNAALWAGGRIDLAAPKADWIASRHLDSADCAWHAGYARMLEAEDRRRGEQPDLARESYTRADRWFQESVALNPEFKDSCDHYRALCAFGRGFAQLLADRREAAALCLVEGLTIRPASASTRDGLDREAIDLLDGSLEWRAGGPSPVDVPALLADLERADPGNAFWPRSISDSELREALRAEGRGEAKECERYLRLSIEAGHRALADNDDTETRRALAQPLTILAERLLARGDIDEARKALEEAAPLLGEMAPDTSADAAALGDLVSRLREKLGAARPRFRPGR